MQHPKVAILGAGSFFFGRKSIWQMVHSPHLRGGTLALVDTDADRLDKMKRLAELAVAHHDAPLKVEAATDRRDVLADADFVILCFAHRNAHYRGVDCAISEKYGIRMCSGDTIGPGGVFRALRELPEIFNAARDIAQLCPDAWVINYINPAAVGGVALQRFFPELKSFALCDAQHGLRQRFANMTTVPNDDKLTVHTAGPNHFTWLLRAEYDGRDLIPEIVRQARERADADFNEQVQGGTAAAKGWLNNSIAIELHDAMGYLPTVLGHTKEYVRYYQGLGTSGQDRHPPLKIFEWEDRVTATDRAWRRVDDFIAGRATMDEFDAEFGPDPATDVIEGMWANLGKPFFINTLNRGAVTNMPDDAVIELACDMDMAGPRPHAVGPMPVGLRGMSQTILDTHELTAQAAWEQRLDLVRRALLVDPLTSSIGDTDALMAELIEAERDALPAWCQGQMQPA